MFIYLLLLLLLLYPKLDSRSGRAMKRQLRHDPRRHIHRRQLLKQ
jgi:hypothetical protein